MTPPNLHTRALTVRPLTGTIGAEIVGVDLAHVDDETFAEVHRLWLDHLVLFFPDQYLDAEAHVALARRFGEPEIHPFIPKLDEAHPEIVVLDSGAGAKADIWHTDVTFSANPPLASLLHMVVCPPLGGDTMWSNQYLAYERLSAPLRETIDGLTAVNTAAAYGRPDVAAVHPMVRVHPETGRRSLFVNRSFTKRIVEMSVDESDALLELLFRWNERPEFHCRYRWQPGAVGIWDNRCTQHYAVNDYTERRVIQRVTVLGDRPTGDQPRWPAWENVTGSIGHLGRSGAVTA